MFVIKIEASSLVCDDVRSSLIGDVDRMEVLEWHLPERTLFHESFPFIEDAWFGYGGTVQVKLNRGETVDVLSWFVIRMWMTSGKVEYHVIPKDYFKTYIMNENGKTIDKIA